MLFISLEFQPLIMVMLIFLVVLTCMQTEFQLVKGETSIRCVERERVALLEFKKGLTDEYGHFSSWESDEGKKECCKWWGVRCSNTTGHVVALQLKTDVSMSFRGKMSPSLIELHHLNVLDLSGFDFEGIRIPKFIGSIKSLNRLRLDYCNFSGPIPLELGNLTNLVTLDLTENELTSIPLELVKLTNLVTLDLIGNMLTSIPIELGNLTNLVTLDLTGNNLTSIPIELGNLTNLVTLVLTGNKLTSIPIELGNLVNLVTLDLSENELTSIPLELGKLTNLFTLDLSDNHLTCIPVELGNLTNLITLDLFWNFLTSSTFHGSNNQLNDLNPDFFGRLSFLKSLNLSGNMLAGGISKSLGNLSHLQELSLSANHLETPVEELLRNLSASTQLVSLDLWNTELTGSISAAALVQFPHLEILDLSSNSLQGTICEAHMMNLTKLKELYLSHNSLALDLSLDWVPPFHLERLYLASCKLGPSFPTWLQSQKDLVVLDLSNSDISDEVPTWFWEFPHKVKFLNISGNQMSGTIPDLSSHLLEVIDISSNKFLGPLPLLHPATIAIYFGQNMFSGSNISAFICTLTNNKNLQLLDLSNNQLAGTLPTCWENMTSLEFLILNNNNFSGEIPYTLGSLIYLRSLHLQDNNLVAELPSSLSNCQYLQMMDIGRNKLTGNIPSWLVGRNYIRMEYLSLSNNRFYGDIPIEICKLNQLRILDLSGNSISGKIPQCFSNFSLRVDQYGSLNVFSTNQGSILKYIEYALLQWKGRESEYTKTLYLLTLIDLSRNKLVGSIPKSFSTLKALISLNLSRNYLTGYIDPNIGEMEMLECLDLSHNQLSGQIPIGLAKLNFLAVLDLADNNLSGKIPSGTQLQSFNASAYAGNKYLCGLPLKPCLYEGLGASINNEGEDIEEKDGGIFSLSFMQEFGISMAFGFIVGFWGFVASLLLKKSWRRAYYNLLGIAGDWFYVTVIIFVNKFKRS